MTLALIFGAAVGSVWLAERCIEQLALGAAAMCLAAALLLLAVGDFERAVLLSSILVLAIFGASSVKQSHSGLKLIVTDFPLLFAGTVPFFLVQYPLAVTAVIAASISLVLATVVVISIPGQPVSL